jgi:5,10-methenyltetrahydrofolate synthetase
MDVTAWRRQRRAELIARRKALPPDAMRRSDELITEFLVRGFPMIEGLTLGFYWPFNGEVDPRVAAYRFRARGARTALPVVVAKHAPLEFREWSPGVATVPGVFGLPVPQTPAVIPEVVLIPPVGFDEGGFRLGYGGGYFDRTLAHLTPQPLKIGLARAESRMKTIHPQPHDIPMDFVITEAGIHEVGASGLKTLDDLSAVAARAELVREARRPLTPAELAALLNTLLEAERAGAKVVAAFISQLSLDAAAQASLVSIQRDESRNCAVLIGLLHHIQAFPSRATGNFLQAALAIEGDRERLAFLNRGQAWVARRVAAALPRITDPRVRDEMQAMHDSHLVNIGVCEKLLEGEPAQ